MLWCCCCCCCWSWKVEVEKLKNWKCKNVWGEGMFIYEWEGWGWLESNFARSQLYWKVQNCAQVKSGSYLLQIWSVEWFNVRDCTEVAPRFWVPMQIHVTSVSVQANLTKSYWNINFGKYSSFWRRRLLGISHTWFADVAESENSYLPEVPKVRLIGIYCTY